MSSHDPSQSDGTSLELGQSALSAIFEKLHASLAGVDWTKVKGVILDLDGVFYTETNEHIKGVNVFMVKALRSLASQRGHLIPISDGELAQIGVESYHEHGHSYDGLDAYLNSLYPGEFDLLGSDFEHMHYLVHNEMIKQAAKDPDYFDETPERARFFELIKKFDHVAILTHGSVDWAKAVVKHLDIQDLFTDDNIYGLETVDFERKDSSDEPFIRILDDMGLKAEDALFVDNTANNHKHPHALGIQTIWIQGIRKMMDQLPDYIDGQAPDLGDIGTHFENWLWQQAEPKPTSRADEKDQPGTSDSDQSEDNQSYTS